MRELSEYLEVVISFTSVSAPFAIAPLFLSLSSQFDAPRRRRNATMAALTIFVTGVLVVYLGEAIFNAFSIGIPSFRVAGGLLVLLTALNMVKDGYTPPGEAPQGDTGDIGVVPIGIPLLCGPGLIATIMVQSHEHESQADNLILCGCVAILALIAWLCLVGAETLSSTLGDKGLDILTRLSGLILSALAIEFIASGSAVLFPGLMG